MSWEGQYDEEWKLRAKELASAIAYHLNDALPATDFEQLTEEFEEAIVRLIECVRAEDATNYDQASG